MVQRGAEFSVLLMVTLQIVFGLLFMELVLIEDAAWLQFALAHELHQRPDSSLVFAFIKISILNQVTRYAQPFHDLNSAVFPDARQQERQQHIGSLVFFRTAILAAEFA